MLEASLFAGLFALLPSAVAGLGVPENRLWPLLSSLLLAYLTFDLLRKRRGAGQLPATSLNRGLVWFSGLGSLVVILIQAFNVADWLVPRGPGPYVFGVTWLTAYSGLTFYRLVTAPMTVSVGRDSERAV